MTTESGPPNHKYSKSSLFYLSTKRDFFSENNKLLAKSLQQNQLYAAQPRRHLCKLCHAALADVADFSSHGVSYAFCASCSHLNGIFDDTKSFIERLYISDGGTDYSTRYIDQDFVRRTTDIYLPKVDFLTNTIRGGPYKLLDIGCGSGYLVYAAQLRGLQASGIDVNKTMVDFGNAQISHLNKTTPLVYASEDAFYQAIVGSEADVISAIGVIEHLREPHRFFAAFRESKTRYLYYSVPMFSFSVVLENVFRQVFPRQLSGGHTHLFTEQSIRKLHQIIGVDSIAEWRFGTDMMDLYRSAMVSLQRNNCSQRMCDYLAGGFGSKLDDMQSILDKNHFCSEIHCVACKA
jgi:SAM-dependent methyltransferase